MKQIYLLFLLVILGACSLNGSQEAKLNQSLEEYIEARNWGIHATYVNYTHPNVLKFYLDQGDKEFKEKFSSMSVLNSNFYKDGLIKTTETSGSDIHVEFDFMVIDESDSREPTYNASIFAISNDDGKNWLFMEEKDYYNNKIFKPKHRLIKR